MGDGAPTLALAVPSRLRRLPLRGLGDGEQWSAPGTADYWAGSITSPSEVVAVAQFARRIRRRSDCPRSTRSPQAFEVERVALRISCSASSLVSVRMPRPAIRRERVTALGALDPQWAESGSPRLVLLRVTLRRRTCRWWGPGDFAQTRGTLFRHDEIA